MASRKRYWFMGMWWTEPQLRYVYNALKREARASGERSVPFKTWLAHITTLAQLRKTDPGGDITL
jgi:hypothetical protein